VLTGSVAIVDYIENCKLYDFCPHLYYGTETNDSLVHGSGTVCQQNCVQPDIELEEFFVFTRHS